MGNKNFKVMVVPRWFTITPETVRALAYVYDYHVRDMPAFLNPDVININDALRAKLRLEGIVQAHAVLDKTNWHHIQTTKKLSSPEPKGYFTGCIGLEYSADGNDYVITTVVDSESGKEYLVTGIRPKGSKDYTPVDIEIPFSANVQEGKEVSEFARHLVETIFPDAGPRPVMICDKQIGTMTIDGKLNVTDPEFKAKIAGMTASCSVRSIGVPGDGDDGTTG